MNPGDYNFKTQRSGDTFTGVRMTATRTSNEVTNPIDLTGAVISMQVRKQACLDPIIDISTDTGGITLEDALNGIFRIEPLIVPQVNTHNYVYDLQFEFPNGVIQTYLKGNFPIQNDVTE